MLITVAATAERVCSTWTLFALVVALGFVLSLELFTSVHLLLPHVEAGHHEILQFLLRHICLTAAHGWHESCKPALAWYGMQQHHQQNRHTLWL